jgi:mannose-6-phosphate isomerase-like protein (cupin superfamily)
MADDVVVDPVFGIRYVFTRTTDPAATSVQHVEMWVQPQGGVTPHVHPSMEERFTVIEGVCEFLDGRRWSSAGAGETVVVPAGTRHAFRNRSGAPAHVRCEARPASTLEAFLRDVAGLSRAGKLTRYGLPKPSGLLASAALASDYMDMVELGFPLPPVAVQRVLLRPLATIARRRGLRGGTFAQLA